jgi:hypothetical protein
MADTVADIPALLDQMWNDQNLTGTTITGKQYARQGQPATGKWGSAKGLSDRVKAIAKAAPVTPPPASGPTVAITSPAEGATIKG